MTHLHQWGKLFWQTDAAGSEEELRMGVRMSPHPSQTAAVHTSNKTGNGGIFHVIKPQAAQKTLTHPNGVPKKKPAKQPRE